MLKDGYEPGMGLGRNGDGTESLLKIAENRGRFGLGYKPTSATNKRRIADEPGSRPVSRSKISRLVFVKIAYDSPQGRQVYGRSRVRGAC